MDILMLISFYEAILPGIPVYSVLILFTGFATAAFMALYPTLNQAISTITFSVGVIIFNNQPVDMFLLFMKSIEARFKFNNQEN